MGKSGGKGEALGQIPEPESLSGTITGCGWQKLLEG